MLCPVFPHAEHFGLFVVETVLPTVLGRALTNVLAFFFAAEEEEDEDDEVDDRGHVRMLCPVRPQPEHAGFFLVVVVLELVLEEEEEEDVDDEEDNGQVRMLCPMPRQPLQRGEEDDDEEVEGRARTAVLATVTRGAASGQVRRLCPEFPHNPQQ